MADSRRTHRRYGSNPTELASVGEEKKKSELPPLFWYMETGDWDKATQRMRRHPREVKTWATLRTKSDSGGSGGTKRLALHHACFKLRSAGSTPPPVHGEDPFEAVCHFILQMIRLYPAACKERESRHGCLPLHLASFASCASRGSMVPESAPAKPKPIGRRCVSEGAALSNDTNQYPPARPDTVHANRETMAVKVLEALLEAYPKACRVDSEGGRLPLHTACAGRATPRIIQCLVTAYPAATRHRNKDGFLPLHLCAHWGVAHPNVAISLLQSYPDATVGRNRWERTPLEEALCMAGENGRPHQAALVRALRKHPTFWSATKQGDPLQLLGRSGHDMVDVDESLASSSMEELTAAILHEGFEQAPPEQPQGLFSRLFTRQESEATNTVSEADLALPLDLLIQKRKWDVVLQKVKNESESSQQEMRIMTRGGFTSSTGFYPLHYACERSPPVEVVQALVEDHPIACLTRCMPGGALPLHIAATWGASIETVNVLLQSGGWEVRDELGNMPVHSACFSGASVEIVQALLEAFPQAIMARNHQGSRPSDICKRLQHENRGQVMQVLERYKLQQSSFPEATRYIAAPVAVQSQDVGQQQPEEVAGTLEVVDEEGMDEGRGVETDSDVEVNYEQHPSGDGDEQSSGFHDTAPPLISSPNSKPKMISPKNTAQGKAIPVLHSARVSPHSPHRSPAGSKGKKKAVQPTMRLNGNEEMMWV